MEFIKNAEIKYYIYNIYIIYMSTNNKDTSSETASSSSSSSSSPPSSPQSASRLTRPALVLMTPEERRKRVYESDNQTAPLTTSRAIIPDVATTVKQRKINVARGQRDLYAGTKGRRTSWLRTQVPVNRPIGSGGTKKYNKRKKMKKARARTRATARTRARARARTRAMARTRNKRI